VPAADAATPPIAPPPGMSLPAAVPPPPGRIGHAPAEPLPTAQAAPTSAPPAPATEAAATLLTSVAALASLPLESLDPTTAALVQAYRDAVLGPGAGTRPTPTQPPIVSPPRHASPSPLRQALATSPSFRSSGGAGGGSVAATRSTEVGPAARNVQAAHAAEFFHNSLRSSSSFSKRGEPAASGAANGSAASSSDAGSPSAKRTMSMQRLAALSQPKAPTPPRSAPPSQATSPTAGSPSAHRGSSWRGGSEGSDSEEDEEEGYGDVAVVVPDVRGRSADADAAGGAPTLEELAATEPADRSADAQPAVQAASRATSVSAASSGSTAGRRGRKHLHLPGEGDASAAAPASSTAFPVKQPTIGKLRRLPSQGSPGSPAAATPRTRSARVLVRGAVVSVPEEEATGTAPLPVAMQHAVFAAGLRSAAPPAPSPAASASLPSPGGRSAGGMVATPSFRGTSVQLGYSAGQAGRSAGGIDTSPGSSSGGGGGGAGGGYMTQQEQWAAVNDILFAARQELRRAESMRGPAAPHEAGSDLSGGAGGGGSGGWHSPTITPDAVAQLLAAASREEA
jgi:hypothetical protein